MQQPTPAFATAPNFTTRQVTNVLNKYANSGHCPEFTQDYNSTFQGTGEYNAKWAKHIELVLAVAGMFKSGTEFAQIAVARPEPPNTPKPQDPEAVKNPPPAATVNKYAYDTETRQLLRSLTPDTVTETMHMAFPETSIESIGNMLELNTPEELANAVQHYVVSCAESRVEHRFDPEQFEEPDQWTWDDQYIDFIGWMLGYNPAYTTRFRRAVLEKLEVCWPRNTRKSARAVYKLSEEETVSDPEFSLTDLEQAASESDETSEASEIDELDTSESDEREGAKEYSEDDEDEYEYEDEDDLEDF